MAIIERVVQLEQEVIVIAVAGDVELLSGQSKIGLKLVDGRQVAQDHRVVKRVLTPPLPLIVAEEKCVVFLDGTAQGESKLILSQLVEAGGRQFTLGIHGI